MLETNDFGLLPKTLDEGRTIIRNLRRVAKLFLTKNVYTLLLVVGALAVRLPFPFQPQHVTLFNALTIGVPALLVMLGRDRSPSASRQSFLGEVGWFVLRTGIIIGVAGLLLMLFAEHWYGRNVGLQQTLVVTALVSFGLVTLLRLLREGESGNLAGLRWFYLLMAGDVLVFLFVMYYPRATFDFFELRPLDWSQWGLVAAVALPATALLYLSDRVRWR